MNDERTGTSWTAVLCENRTILERAEHARRDIEFHRQTAGAYDDETTREFAIYHDHVLRPFLARIHRPGMTAVDLGAGTGVVTLALAECGFRVTAVDHSPDMLEIARHKAAMAGLEDRIEFVQGDLNTLELEAADVVTVQGLLHHLPNLEDGVAAIARALKPGGEFYVSEPCVEATPIGKAIAAVLPYLFAVRRAILRRAPNIAPETVEAPISADHLGRLLDAHGLEHRAEFLTHLPRAHRFVSDRVRLKLTMWVSRPWRRRRGDLVFVFGRRAAD